MYQPWLGLRAWIVVLIVLIQFLHSSTSDSLETETERRFLEAGNALLPVESRLTPDQLNLAGILNEIFKGALKYLSKNVMDSLFTNLLGLLVLRLFV